MARRLHIVAALLLAALFAVSCTNQDDDTADEDEADSSEREAEEDPSSDPRDDATGEDTSDLSSLLAEVANQVSVIRGLPVLEEIKTEAVEPERFNEILLEQGAEADALERTAAAQRVLIALRHLEEGADLSAIQDDLLASSVVGLYDPRDGIAYVSSDAQPLGPAATSTAAHELLHALQDQHFDLTRIEAIPEEDGDALLAFYAVVEGDAVVVEEEWAATHQDDDQRAAAEAERLEDAQDQLAQLRDAPVYIVESLVFPYIAGERFVAALVEEGGYELVDQALEDPPTTTLEILDPDLYLAGDFEQADVIAGVTPGDDWEPLLRSSFGVFDLLALFGSASSPEAAQGSTTWPGWTGGQLEAWQRGDQTVVAAAWVFNDPERAETACGAVTAWYEEVADGEPANDVWQGDRDVLATSCDDTTVRFAIGPDAETTTNALLVD